MSHLGPHSTVSGMDSSYNDHSDMQRQAFEHFWPWLEDAVTQSSTLLPFQNCSTISYADYGCAGGANSAAYFAQVKSALERAGFLGGVSSGYLHSCTTVCINAAFSPCQDAQISLDVYLFLCGDRLCCCNAGCLFIRGAFLGSAIKLTCTLLLHSQDGSSQLQVTLIDVPSNDWNQVAAAFFRPGAVGCAEAILPTMVPKSFYAGEVAPPASLHIGISVVALHWLSHTPPVSLKDSFNYQKGGMSRSSNVWRTHAWKFSTLC